MRLQSCAKECTQVHCVDLGESFQTHIFLQILPSIQPRTSPVKSARPLAFMQQPASARGAGAAVSRTAPPAFDFDLAPWPRPIYQRRGGMRSASRQTLQDSFSAVSKPNFASKHSLESSRRDLHNALLCTGLQSHFLSKICQATC